MALMFGRRALLNNAPMVVERFLTVNACETVPCKSQQPALDLFVSQQAGALLSRNAGNGDRRTGIVSGGPRLEIDKATPHGHESCVCPILYTQF
jgi:hypothetical protein